MTEKIQVGPPKPPYSRRLAHSREWAVEEMSIRVLSLNRAVISYEQYVINAYRYEKFVTLNWFDRRKGITLEEKVQRVYDELKSKLEKENVTIREMKRIEKGVKR